MSSVDRISLWQIKVVIIFPPPPFSKPPQPILHGFYIHSTFIDFYILISVKYTSLQYPLYCPLLFTSPPLINYISHCLSPSPSSLWSLSWLGVIYTPTFHPLLSSTLPTFHLPSSLYLIPEYVFINTPYLLLPLC